MPLHTILLVAARTATDPHVLAALRAGRGGLDRRDPARAQIPRVAGGPGTRGRPATRRAAGCTESPTSARTASP